MKFGGRLRKIVAEAYDRKLAEGNGRTAVGDVVAEVAAELRAGDIAEDLLLDIASDAVDREDQRRTALARSMQAHLFTGDDESLDGLWSIGEGRRVRKRCALRDDYLAHLALLGANVARVTEAYAREQRRASKLLPYMTDAAVTYEAAGMAWLRDNPSDGGAP